VFVAFQEAPTVRVMAILLRQAAGQHGVAARVRLNDGSQVSTPFVPIAAGEHWVEFEWNRATAPEAADGSFLLWLDGNLAGALAGLANGAGGVDSCAWARSACGTERPASCSSTQCGTGSCVDGVCCTTGTCSATCQACDVALSEGSCTAIPSGQDPDGECGLVDCSGYYLGWSGDSCRRKANVSAAQASCNGSSSCRSAAVECGAQTQPAATPQITCHDNCQNPDLATCTGTTAGSCVNVNPGTQTCGTGACTNTVTQCANGAPVTCDPLPAQTEACNDIDDNCDGIIDNALAGDGQEPNNDCSSFRALNGVGSDQTGTYNGQLTLYPAGDADYFRIVATETDSSCGCGAFSFDEDYEMRVTLTVPPNAGSYRVCIGAGACGTVDSAGNCTDVAAGQWATVQTVPGRSLRSGSDRSLRRVREGQRHQRPRLRMQPVQPELHLRRRPLPLSRGAGGHVKPRRTRHLRRSVLSGT
jgi:hypothetical protein